MLKDGHAEKSFLLISQDEAACVMGLVGDTAVREPNGNDSYYSARSHEWRKRKSVDYC